MDNNEITVNQGKFKGYVAKNKIKCIIVAVFLALAVIGLLLSQSVNINYNLSDYLAEDTETNIGLKIMTEEFGMSGNIQVMLTDISKSTAKEVKDEISKIKGALSVVFDENSETSYKEDSRSALFNILVDGDDSSDTAQHVISEIKRILANKYGAVELGGSTIEFIALRENTSSEMAFIIAFSLTLAVILLLITASSWIEPIILLAASGIAIAINMGLNIFLGEISYITNSVAAILQLALSIDYSVALIHAYRDQKKFVDNNTLAMKLAVRMVTSPVSASALTTVAGLIALLFMSFTIGFDIGIVLIKGIAVSAVTALTLLPVLVLLLDPILEKTAKRPFIPSGEIFTKFTLKFHKIIAPVTAAVIILAAVLQSFNAYSFTDSIGSNKKIEETFGRNDSIVVVYKNGERTEDYKKEAELQKLLAEYKNSQGLSPIASYTTYASTVREVYDVKKAALAMGLSESDAAMLLTMYNIYLDKSALKLDTLDFAKFAKELISSDPDVAELVTEDVKSAVELFAESGSIMVGTFNAEGLYNRIDISLLEKADDKTKDTVKFAIDQMYGMYLYNKIDDPVIKVNTLMDFAVSQIRPLKEMGILTDEDIPYSALEISVAVEALKRMNKNNAEFNAFLNSSLKYDELLDEAERILPTLTLPDEFSNMLPESFDESYNDLLKQLYIMFFNDRNITPDELLPAKDLAKFVSEELKTNTFLSSKLDKNLVSGLDTLIDIGDMFSDKTAYDFSEMSGKINALMASISLADNMIEISEDIISGVYIKYAMTKDDIDLAKPAMAYELVNFVSDNMRTNSLLASKMTEEHRAKVDEAVKLLSSADGLFIGENYTRILIGAVIPAEGPEMVSFIDYLLDSIHRVFGDDAHITGKVVSTYDLQAAFALDNTVITVFTIISILLVILIVFKSLSLPVILVLVIQGAVWASLSYQLLAGNPIFFMSYIMTSCILMGATVDYGILMSNNYIVFRGEMSREEALRRAVDSTMPTVFTSGVILTICGFIISIFSTQNSIASVGMLLALGAITSIIMITVALPSILYLLDRFILKFTKTEKPPFEEEKDNYIAE